jgi:hypothetical protein
LSLCFKNVYDSLLLDGKALFAYSATESPYNLLLKSIARSPEFSEYYQNSIFPYQLSQKTIRAMLLKQGYKILDWQENTIEPTYASTEAFQQYVKGWLHFMLPAPEPILNQFLTQLADAAKSQFSSGMALEIPFQEVLLYLEK